MSKVYEDKNDCGLYIIKKISYQNLFNKLMFIITVIANRVIIEIIIDNLSLHTLNTKRTIGI